MVLSIAVYLPALRLPFIDDDYGEIPMAAGWASSGWSPMWHNPNLRARATNMAINAALDHTFGFTPAPFYAVSILVHALCVLLLYALVVWSEVWDETAAFFAACFFAFSEGHQEAVMWISARNESLVMLFGMAAFVCWLKYLRGRRAGWYVLGVLSFLLAAASKESFVIFAILMLLPCIWPPAGVSRRTVMAGIAPFFAIAFAYGVWTWTDRIAQPQYADNRFSLMAPWPLVLVRSLWRMNLVWGMAAIAVAAWTGWRQQRRRLIVAFAWMTLAIVPYSFLTYMPFIASRHSYIASAGLAMLAGTAAASLYQRGNRALLSVLAAVFLAVNVEIIWVKKMSQFRERAEPAVLLREAARKGTGRVTVRCIPFPDFVTEAVLATSGSEAVFQEPVRHDDHCFVVEYKDPSGAQVRIDRRIRTEIHGAFR